MANKKFNIDPKQPLKINEGRPVSEAFLNSFFRVFSLEQVLAFEALYREYEEKIKTINMTPENFMKQINDAYKRYQEIKGLDAFQPMDKKAFEYVDNFMRTSIDKVYAAVMQKKS